MKIEELGYLEKGTGKHQSNTVYSTGGVSPALTAGLGVKYWILIADQFQNKSKNEEFDESNM